MHFIEFMLREHLNVIQMAYWRISDLYKFKDDIRGLFLHKYQNFIQRALMYFVLLSIYLKVFIRIFWTYLKH